MLALFRNNSPYTVIVLFILALLLKLQALIHPVLPHPLQGELLYGYVIALFHYLCGKSAFAYTMLAVVMHFGQALYLNAIAARHRLYSRSTYLPAFAYLILTSLHPGESLFSPQLLMNWLLLGALDISFQLPQPAALRKHIFNLGFLLATAALLQFPAIIFLLLFVVMMLIMRPFHAGEWIVAMLGYFTPFYFFCSALFLVDQLDRFRFWPHTNFHLIKLPAHRIHTAGVVTGLIILSIAGLFALQQQFNRLAISARRAWIVIILSLFFAAAVAYGAPLKDHSSNWLVLAPALSLLTALPLFADKSRRFANFTFWFFIIFILFAQFSLNH